ncbi:cytochrome P450 [Rhizorhabdus dicambivorans]|uniref:Cytochrome P450 n=1 Tax=Rhizorhabdus dicambivorans TaxID=1850238 RepID=A0A2A4FZ18_9SPHN|nr:cytochrome P450 [Rhizorhabdus dicambivorans]ATE65848.1 cytochrome P450 [Rhizorhabdus dicambivorans]PCE42962.1 cytochrome P450 [Rhizorhabdus dicambivorans]
MSDTLAEAPATGGKCPITFTDPDTRKCPFPAYHALREEHPVYKDPVSGNYVLTRYEDVRKAVMNNKTLSCKTGIIQTRKSSVSEEVDRIFRETGYLPMDTLVTNDPPSHKMYRTLVDKAFTRDKVLSLEPNIEVTANALIDRFIDKPEVEFFDEFAMRLPLTVFTDILGVTDRDIDKFKRWNDVSLESSNPALDPQRELEIVPQVTELHRYLAKNVERVRADPDDSLLSTLVHAEVDGRSLDMRELISILFLLFLAGGETTANALAGGIKLLIDRPELADEIRSSDAKLDAFVEETLRIMAPATVMFRRVTADMEIGGVAIPEGSIIETRFGAANIDPSMFPDPEQVDLERPNMRSHLTFGAGIHMCIGNQLARGEMRIAFKALVNRMKNFRATRGEDSYDYTTTYVAFGLKRLWLGFDKR